MDFWGRGIVAHAKNVAQHRGSTKHAWWSSNPLINLQKLLKYLQSNFLYVSLFSSRSQSLFSFARNFGVFLLSLWHKRQKLSEDPVSISLVEVGSEFSLGSISVKSGLHKHLCKIEIQENFMVDQHRNWKSSLNFLDRYKIKRFKLWQPLGNNILFLSNWKFLFYVFRKS